MAKQPATVIRGDCREVLRRLQGNSVDAVVCDPPYEMGFMGKGWDSTGIAYDQRMWWNVLRVLKPGGHLLAFGGSRTYHRMAVAIEDAGFEIRDQLQWLYGSGFPKSHNLGNGWGTALKPAHEPIVLARNPLIGTVAANVAQHGTGALNIDGCRIEGTPRTTHADGNRQGTHPAPMDWGESTAYRAEGAAGRWPANVVLDEESSRLLDAQSGERKVGGGTYLRKKRDANEVFFGQADSVDRMTTSYGDTGGASRFFYCAKASRGERNAGLEGMPEREKQGDRPGSPDATGKFPDHDHRTSGGNNHPTVKPISVMRWLVRLITPPGGLVLDPFCGSGSTGIAARLEGMQFVGIEMDPEYAEIAVQRIRHWVP